MRLHKDMSFGELKTGEPGINSKILADKELGPYLTRLVRAIHQLPAGEGLKITPKLEEINKTLLLLEQARPDDPSDPKIHKFRAEAFEIVGKMERMVGAERLGSL